MVFKKGESPGPGRGHITEQELELDHALLDVIEDVVDFPAGFMAGPILRKREKIEWMRSADRRSSSAAVVSKFVREWDCVSPFDIYPSPGARTLQDGYLIHICRFSPSDLSAWLSAGGN